MDRLQEKNDLLFKLGALFGPLQRLAASPTEYDEQERAEIIARYCDEYPRLHAAFDAFCRGHAGHHYMIEEKRFWSAVQGLMTDLLGYRDLGAALPDRLTDARGH